MDFKEEDLNRVITLLERLKTLEDQQDHLNDSMGLVNQKLEKFYKFSEQLIKISFKLESFSNELSRQAQRDWELDDSINKMNERIHCYGINVTEQMQDIKQLHNILDEYHKEIASHFLELETTLRSDYLSNASFTKLQRNALWAVTSFLGAIILNFIIRTFVQD